MKSNLLIFIIFLFGTNAYAARPTVNANNLDFPDVKCTSLTLTWSNGNGDARMIVGRRGSATAFVPMDGVVYSANSAFGMGTPHGASSDEYILMNGVGTGSVTITNLIKGNVYYFTIYEHDNNGINTQYLVSNAPSSSTTTKNINLDFTIAIIDSCTNSNEFIFTNTSTSNFTGQQYEYVIESNTYNADNPLNFSFLNVNGLRNVTLKAPNTLGCPSSIFKLVKIFPKKFADFNYQTASDTVQDFPDNYFIMDLKPRMMPFPMAVMYEWDFKDGTTSNFSKLRKSYDTSGVFKTRLILTATSYSKTTNCRDTMYLNLEVRGNNPFQNLSINSQIQNIDTNHFEFSLINAYVDSVKWEFGDGMSSNLTSCVHTYSDTGTYDLKVSVVAKYGWKGSINKKLYVIMDEQTGLLKYRISKGDFISIYPNPASDHITIDVSKIELLDHYEIIDMNGKVVMKNANITGDTIELDIKDLNTGTYILKCTGKNGESIEKNFIVR